MTFRKKNSTLEELVILLIMPVTFIILFNMFGLLSDNNYFLFALIFASALVYFVTRWLWFDRSGSLGMGLDAYYKKKHEEEERKKTRN